MISATSRYALMLRFRDLVTEPGGNIAEHRRLIRQRGHVWWGWWARNQEAVPRTIFAQMFAPENEAAEVVLFDTGLMRFYRTTCTRVVVAPSHTGVNSPEFEATPDYYVRGRYPAWFRFEDDILPIDLAAPAVVERPTMCKNDRELGPDEQGVATAPDKLRDDRPTLWVVRKIARNRDEPRADIAGHFLGQGR
jgi:hypothetical protein